MKMDFIFRDYNVKPAKSFTLPVPPSEIRISYGKTIDTINLLQLGEIDFQTGTKLTEITFSSFFPRFYDASYCSYSNIPKPEEALKKILDWIADKSPLVFLITNTSLNDVFNIVNIEYSYRGGDVGDIYYDLHLRRHRTVKVYKVGENPTTQTSQTSKKPVTRTQAKQTAKTYTVKKGDTLSAIAQKMYGNSNKWKDIYTKNKAKIGKDPTKLKEGTVLILP